MRSAPVILALTASLVGGCGALLGLDDHDPPLATETPDANTSTVPDGSTPVRDASGPIAIDGSFDAKDLPECPAQRLVHAVGGNGGFAWFTIVWPLPDLVINPSPTNAYDDLSKVAQVPTPNGHPLYARKVGAQTVLQGLGQNPEPTAFVAGMNETHTNQPISTDTFSTGQELVEQAVLAQLGLSPKAAVLQWSPAGPFMTGVVPAITAGDIDTAVAALQAAAKPTDMQAASLRIDDGTLTAWGAPPLTTPSTLTSFARELYFAAAAFELNALGSIIVPAFNDDPKGAFNNPMNVTQRTDILTQILNGFYGKLAKAHETTCGHRGEALSLADNVVLFINGDTPLDSFDKALWGAGTVGSANLMYVRSNGFLVPGWFGYVSPTARSDFDPQTGTLVSTSANSVTASTNSALGGLLYAITRGNTNVVNKVGAGPYSASLAPAPP